ncbi:hypothetical protein GFL39_25965 [Rhizobium leguminosarum bv. viciae]|uniref:hypothetical protein n=1 Tax=Rhizobium leguminosarum TaxID=384 RepID=UPI0014423294|nr:hypothetical protein [Rhizobium leguminosarum]NKL08319.1 hypothetical protein [Rhizobium leguminosarum bv. viciae]
MREKAELTEEAQSQIEQALRDSRSDQVATRMKALDQIRRLQVLYGREAIEGVEDSLAERRYEEMQAEAWSMGGADIVWD